MADSSEDDMPLAAKVAAMSPKRPLGVVKNGGPAAGSKRPKVEESDSEDDIPLAARLPAAALKNTAKAKKASGASLKSLHSGSSTGRIKKLKSKKKGTARTASGGKLFFVPSHCPPPLSPNQPNAPRARAERRQKGGEHHCSLRRSFPLTRISPCFLFFALPSHRIPPAPKHTP